MLKTVLLIPLFSQVTFQFGFGTANSKANKNIKTDNIAAAISNQIDTLQTVKGQIKLPTNIGYGRKGRAILSSLERKLQDLCFYLYSEHGMNYGQCLESLSMYEPNTADKVRKQLEIKGQSFYLKTIDEIFYVHKLAKEKRERNDVKQNDSIVEPALEDVLTKSSLETIDKRENE